MRKDKNRLTGRFYHKQTWLGLILMVEYLETVCDFAGDESPDRCKWRKAKPTDMAEKSRQELETATPISDFWKKVQNN